VDTTTGEITEQESVPVNTYRDRLIAKLEQRMQEADDSGAAYPPSPNLTTATDKELEDYGRLVKKAMDDQAAFLKAENVRKGTTPEGIIF
jgi:hypothetical protein